MTIGKNCYWCGNKHRGYGFGEWRFFWWKLTSIHVHLKFSAYFFFGIKKTPTLKISTNQLPPWTITTWNIPAHVFKYSGPRFLAYFSLMLPLSLILLKRLCFKSAEVFTFVKICQNEVLSEERQLMKWVGIFQTRIFWVAVFRGEIF